MIIITISEIGFIVTIYHGRSMKIVDLLLVVAVACSVSAHDVPFLAVVIVGRQRSASARLPLHKLQAGKVLQPMAVPRRASLVPSEFLQVE